MFVDYRRIFMHDLNHAWNNIVNYINDQITIAKLNNLRAQIS